MPFFSLTVVYYLGIKGTVDTDIFHDKLYEQWSHMYSMQS